MKFNIFLFLLVMLLLGCKSSKRNATIMLFQTTSIQSNYLISINEDTMNLKIGVRNTKSLSKIKRNERPSSASLKLDNIVYSKKVIIDGIVSKLLSDDFDKLLKSPECNEFYPGWSTDTWGVIILVDNKQYVFEYPTKNKVLNKLLQDFQVASPIPLFDNKFEYLIPVD